MKVGDMVYDLDVSDLGIIIGESVDATVSIWWWNPAYTDGSPLETTENYSCFAEYADKPERANFCLFNNKEKYESRGFS